MNNPTIEEAADILGISHWTIRRHLRLGFIEADLDGNKKRLKPGSIEKTRKRLQERGGPGGCPPVGFSMNEKKTKELIGGVILKDGELFCEHIKKKYPNNSIHWIVGSDLIELNDVFNIETLEAILWWIKNNLD